MLSLQEPLQAISLVAQNGFSTNGYFYGNGAKELGGTYKNAAGTVSGAYGAKK